MGQNVWVVPKRKEGFWENFTTRGMVKTRMDQNQRNSPKPKRFLFRRKINPRNAFEKKNSEERFLRRV